MKFSVYSLTALNAQLLISSFRFFESSAFNNLSPTLKDNRGRAVRTNGAELDSSRSTGARYFPSFASAVEDDIDSVLDSMLGEIYASENASEHGEHEDDDKEEHISGSRPMPSELVEEDDIDVTDPKVLSITNPRWVKAGLDPQIIDVLSGKGFTKFTPVQAEAFAPILAGRDVIGRSRTGTGKTLAFGLPSITRLVKKLKEKGVMNERGGLRRGRAVSMLVLCPTRELARQVQEELKLVTYPSGLFVEVFHGGVSYDPQSRALRSGLDILVGTPGRVIDHMERGNLDLSECEVAVLDEADEMLNMGFADDVEIILKGVGSRNEEKTQCLLFSATTPSWVKEIGRQYQQDVLSIDSTSEESGARTATTVRHLAVQLPPGPNSKKSILEDIIAVEISKDSDDVEESVDEDENPIAAAAAQNKKKTNSAMQQKIFGKTIVFTQTKKEADELVSGGVFKSLTSQSLHGDVSQRQRDATLAAFRQGAFNVLVATDVAARGIDIQDVDLVIQLDPPRDVDTYVHRSGRTGRAGNKGVSVLLFNHYQSHDIVKIERDLGHGFKFELAGPPSTEAALNAAAKTSAIACRGIPDETAVHFKESARALLEGEESAEDVVARCLAAISRRSASVQSRSLLTGEEGLVTVQMRNERGNRVEPRDVIVTIGKLSSMSQLADRNMSFDADVGKIQSNVDPGTAIFDMSAEDGKRLVEFSKDVDLGEVKFEVLKELEIERTRNFGRNNQKRNDRYDGRGRRGNRQGEYNRKPTWDRNDRGRDRGRRSSDREFERDFSRYDSYERKDRPRGNRFKNKDSW